MIVPTVGRQVWYRPGSYEPGMAIGSDSAQPLAATVVYVWNDTMVNLQVLDSNGHPHRRTSVLLWQGEHEPPYGSGYCEWMPYQIGQAKREQPIERTTDLEAERGDLYPQRV